MKKENGKLKNRIFTACSTFALVAALASCSQLQNNLSSEQLVDQKEGIGSVSKGETVYYYNGNSTESVKGNEAHIALKLTQLADASKAGVKYELTYSMTSKNGDNTVKTSYTSSGDGKGTLSDSKTQYYVDLSQAINLIDGTENPKYSDIALTFTVLGLTNASENSYKGRSFPSYSQSLKFAPLYQDKVPEVSTKDTVTTFELPLNGKIVSVDEKVTLSSTDAPSGVTFTAKKSDDGKKIIITASEDLKGREFTANFALTGIKPVGSKESYSHTFSGVKFVPLPNKSFTGSDMDGTPKRVFTANDVKDLDIVKISFGWTGSPSWIVGIATSGDDTDDWGDDASYTKIENITTSNTTIVATDKEWSQNVINKIKENGLKIAGGGTFSITVKVYYKEQ